MEQAQRMLIKLVSSPVRFYKYWISPVLPSQCRFYPSCSQYTLEALEHYGIVRGLLKSCGRLLRCHPWSNGGFDPVQLVEEKD